MGICRSGSFLFWDFCWPSPHSFAFRTFFSLPFHFSACLFSQSVWGPFPLFPYFSVLFCASFLDADPLLLTLSRGRIGPASVTSSFGSLSLDVSAVYILYTVVWGFALPLLVVDGVGIFFSLSVVRSFSFIVSDSLGCVPFSGTWSEPAF